MTQLVRISQVGEYMSRHFVDVFESLLGLPTQLSAKSGMPVIPRRVSATVGLVGASATGAVFVHFSDTFALRAATVMLGRSGDDLMSPGEVNEVVGEIGNLLAGGLKSWLNDVGIHCVISVPAIIRGTSFVIEAMPEVEREVLIFESAGEFVVVEVHFKLIW